MTSLAQPAMLAAQSRLASQIAQTRIGQSRLLVSASQQCCAASRQALTSPHGTPAARAQAGQPAERPQVTPALPPANADRLDGAS